MKLLVIGESCQDIFSYGTVTRICPEAPVPVFNPTNSVHNHGMAGNVARNLEALGVDFHDIVLLTNTESIVKERFVETKSNQMMLRVDRNDKAERISGTSLEYYLSQPYDAIIVSDYDKGFLTEEDLAIIGANYHVKFIDTKKVLGAWASDYDFIKINEAEYQKTKHSLEQVSDWPSRLITTYGEKGAFYQGIYYPVPQVEFRDVSGAGDTFLAALVYEYLDHGSIENAIEFANQCAAKVVQKHGVTTV